MNSRYVLVVIYFPLTLTSYLCKEIVSPRDAMKYLEHFGYIPSDEGVVNYAFSEPPERTVTKRMFSKGIAMFQMFTGLNQSGHFDEDTKTMMNMPRCGMAEKIENMENKNLNSSAMKHRISKKRKWKASTIYYKIGNFPSSFEMDTFTVKKEIRRAFGLWEDVANIRCIELEEADVKPREIDIIFASGEHGDGNANAFGQETYGNVVAHAFFPTHRHFDGDIHFNDNWHWTAYNNTGINLFQVAAHEIGHALGLDHSRFPDSVMHMIVKNQHNESFQLHDDDIQGIQKLYGPRRMRQYKRKHFNHVSTKLHHEPIISPDMQFGERMVVQTPSPQVPISISNPQSEVINLNAVIVLPMKDDVLPSTEISPLYNFWNCFTLNQDKSQTSRQDMANCYKQNVIRLLYSLKIV